MRHLQGTLRSRGGGALTIMGAIGRNCGEEYTDGGVYKKQCWVWDRRGEAIIDMRSALGTVSGSKAPLTTVHANLEAIVVRARRHQ
jgi:hypothetical protein